MGPSLARAEVLAERFIARPRQEEALWPDRPFWLKVQQIGLRALLAVGQGDQVRPPAMDHWAPELTEPPLDEAEREPKNVLVLQI